MGRYIRLKILLIYLSFLITSSAHRYIPLLFITFILHFYMNECDQMNVFGDYISHLIIIRNYMT